MVNCLHYCRRLQSKREVTVTGGSRWVLQPDVRSGVNSHYFHIIGDKLINPIVGVYIPIIRIPIKGGMAIPNIATFDHGIYTPPESQWLVQMYFLLKLVPPF